MKRLISSMLVSTALMLAACSNNDNGPADPGTDAGEFKVLVYTRTGGFRHRSIPDGIEAFRSLGAENGFGVDATEDPAVFTDDNLAQYAVIAFVNTTGTIVDTAEQRGAIERFIGGGGGFVGIHSAADTEYDWPFYGQLVGAYFKNHPLQQYAAMITEAPDHPATAHFPERWTIYDEFYAFQTNPRESVRVLLAIDEGSYLQNPNTSQLPTSPTFPVGETGTMGD
ncbi:MAG: ThuA domain-containing protein, partial [Pseudomonadota bacterium]|nr:ThuA domain-containing protein [Pseudomonadota bacterium]